MVEERSAFDNDLEEQKQEVAYGHFNQARFVGVQERDAQNDGVLLFLKAIERISDKYLALENFEVAISVIV